MAEIELKLGLSPKAVRQALTALARLPGAQASSRERLDATYFDTPSNALWRNGLTLRLRQEGEALVQTVKSASNGAIARGEWNDTITGTRPELRASKSGRKARKVLGPKGKLKPKFRAAVTRTKLLIVRPNLTIEAALDRGKVQAGRASAPICELELELTSGHDVAALYDIALRLAHAIPLHIEGRSKSTRGYALVTRKPFDVVRAGKVPLQPWQTLGGALAAAGRAHLGQFTGNLPLPEARAEEAVHQMRVALRRLRGLLKAAEEMLPPDLAAWANHRLKRVLQALGSARNWDVLRQTLEAAPGLPRRRTAAHRRLIQLAEEARARAHAEAAVNIAAPAVTRTMLELGHWFEGLGFEGLEFEGLAARQSGDLEMTLDKAAPRILDRAFKRLRRKSRDFAKLTPEDRHRLRIVGKNLRYAAELFAPLYKKRPVRTFLAGLREVQDLLGALNDIHGAHALLKHLAPSGPTALAAGEVLGRLDRKAAGLEKRAARAVRRLRAAPTFW